MKEFKDHVSGVKATDFMETVKTEDVVDGKIKYEFVKYDADESHSIIYHFYKITEMVAPASKKYSCRYLSPMNCAREKIVCNGLSQRNTIFTNPFDQCQKITKLNFACMKELYFNHEIDHSFDMPDKLKKIHVKRTQEQINQKLPMMSIHSSQLTRELFKTEFRSRAGCNIEHHTVPHGRKN